MVVVGAVPGAAEVHLAEVGAAAEHVEDAVGVVGLALVAVALFVEAGGDGFGAESVVDVQLQRLLRDGGFVGAWGELADRVEPADLAGDGNGSATLLLVTR